MNGFVDWIAIVGAGGGVSIVAFITFWMTLSSRITDATNHANSASKAADHASVVASSAIAKCEFLSRDIAETRTEMATKIAGLQAVTESTTRSLTQAETRLANSIDDLGQKMDHLADTIIKTLGDLIGRGINPR